MEDIVKMQLDLMNKMTSNVDSLKESVKILTNKLDSLTAAHAMGRAEQKLPSQPEENHRGHCGAIVSREAILLGQELLGDAHKSVQI
jgi:hypothetical protein